MYLEDLLKDFRKEMDRLEESLSAWREDHFIRDLVTNSEPGHYLTAVPKKRKENENEWMVVKMVK